ncbi:MAG: HEPN domain-containing protein [Bacteroidetes bacterium]|nr:HEPN domain-containing protein [Bacteroidota bacterium]MCL6098757.1 HEPN domain-containing protein [Bacteroidota bacterium]
MKSKEEHIRYWLIQAEDDWEAVDALLKGKKNLQSLFFAHLVIEKICKALWIKYNQTNIPPKTHNLNFLLSQTPLPLSDEQNEFLLNLNRFQLEGRYPEYITKMQQICNYDFTHEMIAKTKEIKLWLQEKVQ